MANKELDVLLNFFKVLANESRLKILGLLASEERSVEELASLLKLKEPTISHHLNKLKKLDLVNMKSQKNTHLYFLNKESIRNMNKKIFIGEIEKLAEDIEEENWENKVLSNFLEEDEIIKNIPSSRKKRLIVYKWLVEKFEFGKKYKETEVNKIIKKHHPDSSTIRREFIGYKLMAREKGIYWRIQHNY